MKRQTKTTNNSHNSNAGVVLALVAAAALVAGACGGVAPGGGADDPAETSLDVPPPDEDPTLDQMRFSSDLVTADGTQLRQQADLTDGPVQGTPSYKKAQVLSLCEGGKMTVKHELVQQQLEGTFTLELWLRVTREDDQRVLGAGSLSLGIHNRRVEARVAGRVLKGLNVVRNEWYHVALVVDGQTLALFVNGMRLDSQDVANREWKRPSGALVIGGDAGAGRAFCGKVDSVRLSGKRLYTADFYPKTELNRLDSGAFFYDFDDQKLDHEVVDAGYWQVDARIDGDAALMPGAV